jgi:hypothetical protein
MTSTTGGPVSPDAKGTTGPRTYTVSLDGGFLARGFWIYVWEVRTPEGLPMLYVGRTGDSSSPNAQSPFNRMGQHLGFAKNSSMLRNHLESRGVSPGLCVYRLISHGPILAEADDWKSHVIRRDRAAAVERQLAEDLVAAGHDVLNAVNSRMELDEELYGAVRAAFAELFDMPEIATPSSSPHSPSSVASSTESSP